MRTPRPDMVTPFVDADGHRGRRWKAWLDRPLASWWCVLGWFASATAFIGLTRLFGGPTQADTGQSVFSTWAIAHGAASCAYPPSSVSGIAPLYPLLSGGIEALFRVGERVPFPSQAALGFHCSNALNAMYAWSTRSDAIVPTILISYIGWFVLMAGLVSLLRTSGLGRRGWEPAVLILVAIAPPVLMPIEEFFHPEDLVAMGLCLGALACVRRGYWSWAGLLLGLAITSQQFAVLIFAPLVVVSPVNKRIRFFSATIGTAALVVGALAVITSGDVIKAVLGGAATQSDGRTVLSALHLHGPALFAFSRALPILLAITLAWWALRRFGPSVLEPALLVSLVATSMTFRLVFEVNLYGYYLMAAAVLLIVLDVLRGRLRALLVLWLVLSYLAFMPLPWGYDPWGNTLPIWLWQILLVPTAVGLAVGPLLSAHSRPSFTPLPIEEHSYAMQ